MRSLFSLCGHFPFHRPVGLRASTGKLLSFFLELVSPPPFSAHAPCFSGPSAPFSCPPELPRSPEPHFHPFPRWNYGGLSFVDLQCSCFTRPIVIHFAVVRTTNCSPVASQLPAVPPPSGRAVSPVFFWLRRIVVALAFSLSFRVPVVLF